jgi:hypothetical protein
MQEQEGLPAERVSFWQLAQYLTGEEVQSVPTGGIAYPVVEREREPGQDIFKQRVRVSFEFDCSVNSEPIMSTSNDSDVKAHDIALLTQFLHTDKAIELMVDKIGAVLGMDCDETFIQTFLSQIDTDCHSLFGQAIAELSGENGEYWRDIRDGATVKRPDDLLSICTEEVIKCFMAKFVSSSFEIVEDEPRVIHNHLDGEAIKAAKHLQVKKGK